jgi:hypothetical protein
MESHKDTNKKDKKGKKAANKERRAKKDVAVQNLHQQFAEFKKVLAEVIHEQSNKNGKYDEIFIEYPYHPSQILARTLWNFLVEFEDLNKDMNKNYVTKIPRLASFARDWLKVQDKLTNKNKHPIDFILMSSKPNTDQIRKLPGKSHLAYVAVLQQNGTYDFFFVNKADKSCEKIDDIPVKKLGSREPNVAYPLTQREIEDIDHNRSFFGNDKNMLKIAQAGIRFFDFIYDAKQEQYREANVKPLIDRLLKGTPVAQLAPLAKIFDEDIR